MSGIDAPKEQEQSDAASQRFSLIVGGPFNALLGHCGMLDADRLPTATAACVLALLAWMVPGAFAIAQGLVEPAYAASLYFEDFSTLSRLLIGVAVLVATERHADRRIAEIMAEFWEERLVVGEARRQFFSYLRAADRQSSSAVVQIVLLAIALVGPGKAMQLAISLEHTGWEGVASGGTVVLSWAGQAARWSGFVLIQFLVLLWLWRFGVWSLLLYRISRLPLQLTALHPDRVAGLGFLGLFPGVFRGFVFALSCVVASLLYKDLQAVDGLHDIDLLRNIGTLWVGFVMVLFNGPLCVFYAPLFALREAELTSNGRTVNRWYKEFHSHWLAGETPAEPADGERKGPSLGDLNAALDALRDMRTVPVDRATTMQLLLAAVAPLVVVGATQIPLPELLGRLAGFAL